MNNPRAAGQQLHTYEANITLMGAGSKQPLHKWKRYYDTPQTRADVDALPWRDAVGVGVLNGINGWRTFDVDKCPSAGPVDAILRALGLPADYRWVWHSGSGTGWEIAFRCFDDLPAGVLAAKDDEPGVFWGVPKDGTSFHHIELRWDRCQTIYPPSQYEDATKPGYRWRGEAPSEPPAVVTAGHVLAGFFAAAKLKEPPKAPAASKPARSTSTTTDTLDRALEEIRQRFDLVAYAKQQFGGEAREERGEIRIPGHGGLLIRPDEDVWYTFQDQVGGDCFELVGKALFDGRWDNSDGRMFMDAVKAAAAYTNVILPAAPSGITATKGADGRYRFEVRTARAQAAPPAEPDTAPPRRLLHADELGTLPKPEWLIEGVLPKNKIAQIFGRAGVGKSHINLDIALSAAQYTNVIYIAAEDAEDYQDRIPAWCEQHGLGTGGLHFWPEPVNLMNLESVDAFLAEAAPLQPGLIVVDTLALCMTGADENSTQHMGIAIDALNYIRRQTSAAILVTHHTGWTDQHERGNSSLRAACRVVMKLSQSDDGLMTLTCEKINGAKPFEPRYFRLIPRAESVAVVPSSKLTTRDTPLKAKHYALLEALNLSIFADGASFTQLVEHLDLPKSTVNHAISKLLEHGYIEHEGGRNKHYKLTASGRAELQSYLFNTTAASSSQVQGTYGQVELALNWAITLPENRETSSSQVQASSSADSVQVQASSNVVQPAVVASSEFSSMSPPLRGDRLNSNHLELEHVEHDQRVLDDVDGLIRQGQFREAKSRADALRDTATWNHCRDRIDDAIAATTDSHDYRHTCEREPQT